MDVTLYVKITDGANGCSWVFRMGGQYKRYCKANTASCKNIDVQLDANGSVTLAANDIDNGSYDDCSTVSFPSRPPLSIVGMWAPQPVVLTVTDNNSNAETCTATVTVKDDDNPCCPFTDRIYVDIDATGNNDGTSWADAFTDLQPALDASCGGVTEIWVAEGTYLPTETTNGSSNNRQKAFHFDIDLQIFGGFNGTETDRSDRNPEVHITALSGDIGTVGDNTDNSYHVVVAVNQTGEAVIDGFTIENGQADVDANFNYSGVFLFQVYGGGVYCRNSAIKISNCIFKNNFASIGGAISYTGFNAIGVIQKCTFFYNVANNAQGADIHVSNGTANLSNNLFGTGGGSSVNLTSNAIATFTNCTFGVHGLSNSNSTATLYNSIYRANSLPISGGTANWKNCNIKNSGGSGAGWNPAYGNDLGGNIDEDPLFTDPANNNFTLTECSPCVNTGDNASNLASEDLASNTRVFGGTIDMGAYEFQGTPPADITCYQDSDMDGFGDHAVSQVFCDVCGTGFVSNNTDCDDTNTALNPNTVWYLDADNDGYTTGSGVTQCASPSTGYRYTGILGSGDCNDGDAAIHPGAAEVCNDIDDNCNSLIDDGVTCIAYVINGNIVWEHDLVTPVADVHVALSGDDTASDLSDGNGDYEIPTIGGNLVITPTKNDAPRQGVDAADVLRIKQHVLGNRLNDGYKVIAADVNENNAVTNADATIIQYALLGNANAGNHLDNPAWRFVDEAHTFAVPNAPWGFPAFRTSENAIPTPDDNHFIGIKMGDVNGSWNAPDNLTGQPMIWQVANEAVVEGQLLLVSFSSNQTLPDVAAWQFALKIDPTFATVKRIIPHRAMPLSTEDFNILDGELRSVFAQPQGQVLKAGEAVFTLELYIHHGGVRVSDILQLVDNELPGRLYDTKGEGSTIKLAFTPGRDKPVLPHIANHETMEGFELYQNTPNPFATETVIAFNLPTDMPATLSVHDASGRVVVQLSGNYTAGYNTLRLTHEVLKGATGILTYTVTTGTYTATRRMLLVD
ncbi:MAG: MopE-related protein [Saprospiraceae bacterium]